MPWIPQARCIRSRRSPCFDLSKRESSLLNVGKGEETSDSESPRLRLYYGQPFCAHTSIGIVGAGNRRRGAAPTARREVPCSERRSLSSPSTDVVSAALISCLTARIYTSSTSVSCMSGTHVTMMRRGEGARLSAAVIDVLTEVVALGFIRTSNTTSRTSRTMSPARGTTDRARSTASRSRIYIPCRTNI